MAKKRRANGEGTIRERYDGRWEARYTHDSKIKSIYAKTQSEARKKLNQILNDIENNLHTEDTKISVSAWIDNWLYSYKKIEIKQKTFENYETLIKTHIRFAFTNITLKNLKTQHIQKFINEKMASGKSTRTVKYLYVLINGALEQALKNNLIVRNVAKAVTLPKQVTKERRVLSPTEQERMIKLLDKERMGTAILLALNTGLRRGELLALRWSDYDKKAGCIIVKQNLSRLKGEDGKSHLTFTTPKTKSSIRTIPLLPKMIAKLNEHYKIQSEYRLKVGRSWIDNDLIFPTDTGEPCDPRNLQRVLKRLSVKLDIPNVNPHSLRHSFATRALERGLSLKAIQKILGHNDISVTGNIYTHASTQLLEKEMQKLKTAF